MDYTLIKSMERFKAKRLELGLSFQKLADDIFTILKVLSPKYK